LEIHLSTQANNTNYRSAIFWHKMGVKRIILARELSLEEIRQIRENTPESLELEAFVHGAMCMSYSGRCTISNYLNWKRCQSWGMYTTLPLALLCWRKKGLGIMPIVEDDRGTYLFNSKDLCMLEHIPELARLA
jgi:putative protease